MPWFDGQHGKMIESQNSSDENGGFPSVTSSDDQLAEEATAWFVRMSSDDVGADDRRAFSAWLDRSPAHRIAYADAEALWSELGGILDPRTRGGRDADRRHGTGRRRPYRFAALAASFALVVAAGLWSSGAFDRFGADHATAVGETRQIALDDGSRVHLNSNTALALDFTAACRCVRLIQGEAFFTVASDAARPFQVAAGPGLSRAIGTAFNVRDDGDAVIVSVAEGEVHVTRESGGAGKDGSAMLAAGDFARYGPTGAVETGTADVEALTAWRRGRLVFADRRLRDVVAELDRYRPGAIVFLESAIAEARFTGVFDLSDTDLTLDAIETTLAVDVVRVTPWLTVLRAGD